MKTVFFLMLSASAYYRHPAVVIPHPFRSEEACRTAGAEFVKAEPFSNAHHRFYCVAVPTPKETGNE